MRCEACTCEVVNVLIGKNRYNKMYLFKNNIGGIILLFQVFVMIHL